MDWQLLISPEFEQWLRRWGRRPWLPGALMARLRDELAANPDAHLEVIAPLASPRVYHAILQQGTEFLHVSVYVARFDDRRVLRVESGRIATQMDDPANEE